MNFPVYGIGSTAAGITRLDLLGLPWPKAEAVDYAAYVTKGDGQAIGQGWLRCAWRFTSLTTAQAAILLAFVGTCYIRTLEQDGTYGRYQALMVNPQRRSPKAAQLLDYVIEFRKLVAA